jgi:hypothetical protein
MFSLLLAVVTLSAAPVQLAQTELRGANVSKDSIEFFAEHLAARLRVAGFTVVTQREIAAILGLERQRLLLGCEADGSCVAELASALGAAGVLTGTVGHFGDIFQVNLKVLKGTDATVIGEFSEQVGTEKAVLDAIDRGARSLSRQVHPKLGRPVPEGVQEVSSLRARAWIPAVGGGVFVVAGAVLLVLAGTDYAALTGPGAHLQTSDSLALASGGSLKRWLGVGGLSLGGAAMVVSALLFALGGTPSTTVAVAPTDVGAGAVLLWSGVLP